MIPAKISKISDVFAWPSTKLSIKIAGKKMEIIKGIQICKKLSSDYSAANITSFRRKRAETGFAHDGSCPVVRP